MPDQIWASAASLQKLNLAGNALKALDPGQLAPCTALQVGAKPTFHRQPFGTARHLLVPISVDNTRQHPLDASKMSSVIAQPQSSGMIEM